MPPYRWYVHAVRTRCSKDLSGTKTMPAMLGHASCCACRTQCIPRGAACVPAPSTALCTCCRRGERFVRGRHEGGTEVKAITYSAMQILEREGEAEIFVVVDI